jgi:hypothetical protein
MVYFHDVNFYKMNNGGTHSDWSRGGWGRDNVSFQKTQNDWSDWSWRPHKNDGNHKGRWRNCGDTNDENLPLFDCLERSLLTRGPSRRTYSLRVLETRYPCENREDASESPKPGSRKYKKHASKSARSLYGDQQVANSCEPAEEEEHQTKKMCRDNRRASNDSICSRVLQALGDNLIVEFLTPKEVHNIEIAFNWDYDWGRAWHGGRVKNKAVAAHVQYDLQMGLQAEHMLAKYNKDLAFSAFWYLVGVGEIERLANKYKHYKTIRKLCRFLS